MQSFPSRCTGQRKSLATLMNVDRQALKPILPIAVFDLLQNPLAMDWCEDEYLETHELFEFWPPSEILRRMGDCNACCAAERARLPKGVS